MPLLLQSLYMPSVISFILMYDCWAKILCHCLQLWLKPQTCFNWLSAVICLCTLGPFCSKESHIHQVNTELRPFYAASGEPFKSMACWILKSPFPRWHNHNGKKNMTTQNEKIWLVQKDCTNTALGYNNMPVQSNENLLFHRVFHISHSITFFPLVNPL